MSIDNTEGKKTTHQNVKDDYLQPIELSVFSPQLTVLADISQK